MPLFNPSYSYDWGTGSDGDAVLDGVATVAWASLAGSTYTMTRSVYARNLTVNSGVTLAPVGHQIWAKSSVAVSGTVHANGQNASGSTAGTAAINGSFYAGSTNGGAGGTAAGSNGSGVSAAYGGSGGAGGAGTWHTSGMAMHIPPPLVVAGIMGAPFPFVNLSIL